MRRFALLIVFLFALTASLGGAAYAQPVQSSALVATPTKDPCRDDQGNEICPYFIAFDNRVNALDPLAPMTGYCYRDGTFQLYKIINSVGTFLANASRQQVVDGLTLAIRTGQPQLILNVQGYQFAALPNYALQLLDNATGSGYRFTFRPNACALPETIGQFQPSTAPIAPAAANPTATPKGATAAKPSAPVVRSGPIPAVSASSTEAQATIDLNIRKEPTNKSRRLGFIPKGGVMKLVAQNESGEWMKVQYGSVTGWVVAFYTNVQVGALKSLPVEK
jgi:hypothetical protein